VRAEPGSIDRLPGNRDGQGPDRRWMEKLAQYPGEEDLVDGEEWL
jgi:hypothetical protein